MKHSRYVVIACSMALLAACHSSGGGGGGGGGVPPPPTQTYAASVTGVEVVRAADELVLPVAGLPSTSGGSIVVTP